jgi:L-amino acid N-acyltransferase YncA
MTTFGRTDAPKLKFRLGKPDDVRPLLEKYGADHFDEGGFGAFSTFDLERAVREMRSQVERDDTPVILAETDDEFVGWMSWTMMHVFTVQPIAVLWTIYVRPEYRQGAVGRQLILAAMDIAKTEGACAFFATVAPTSPGGQALCHLFRSFGFEPMGGAFSRRL